MVVPAWKMFAELGITQPKDCDREPVRCSASRLVHHGSRRVRIAGFIPSILPVERNIVATVTDPARELAELCERLSSADGNRGDHFLASKFDVPAWSFEFYQIIFCIVQRIEMLEGIINDLDTDEDIKSDAIAHLGKIKSGFDYNCLATAWNQRGHMYISRENFQAIKMLSSLVRERVSYPKLTAEETDEVLALVDNLISWLLEHQIKDNDFIRQALIDGLRQFKFRLEHLKWLGWGYTISSLRDVIGAYLALERGVGDPAQHPDASAVLLKTNSFLKEVYDRTKTAKDIYGVGDFLVKMYVYGSLAYHSKSIAGFITAASGVK